MSFISLVCRAPVFLLWLLHVHPCGHHLHPLSGSRLSHVKGCACTGGRASQLGCPPCAPLRGEATFVVWTCLSLPDFGRGLCLALCSRRPVFPSVGQDPVTFPKSLPITCPLVVARTQRCQLLIPAQSHACYMRQGHLGGSTLCSMRIEMCQTWVWQKGLASQAQDCCIERPAGKVGPWLASGNLNTGRVLTIPW